MSGQLWETSKDTARLDRIYTNLEHEEDTD
jgi:hypothetical protein